MLAGEGGSAQRLLVVGLLLDRIEALRLRDDARDLRREVVTLHLSETISGKQRMPQPRVNVCWVQQQ